MHSLARSCKNFIFFSTRVIKDWVKPNEMGSTSLQKAVLKIEQHQLPSFLVFLRFQPFFIEMEKKREFRTTGLFLNMALSRKTGFYKEKTKKTIGIKDARP